MQLKGGDENLKFALIHFAHGSGRYEQYILVVYSIWRLKDQFQVKICKRFLQNMAINRPLTLDSLSATTFKDPGKWTAVSNATFPNSNTY